MKIGVIGIGEMGGTSARRWCAKGHTVRVANSRGTSAAKPFADAIGAEATDIYGAVDGADVVLLAMAFPIAATLPGDLFSQTPGDLIETKFLLRSLPQDWLDFLFPFLAKPQYIFRSEAPLLGPDNSPHVLQDRIDEAAAE